MTGSPSPPSSGPPPLPPIRGGIAYIVVPGTVAWFAAFAGLLFFADSLRAHNAMIWLWTCLAGGILGLIGLGIYSWQRSAARRGRRGAQTSALE
jgi:hypothetical protein